MADDPHDTPGPERGVARLDRSVQEHLGRKLRAAYAEIEDKPAYLGDPALPPELEHKLLEMEESAVVHEKGVEAVRDALGMPAPAHQKGIEAVREALAKLQPPDRAED